MVNACLPMDYCAIRTKCVKIALMVGSDLADWT